MPIYEYQCTSCSNEFELKSSFNGKSDVSCPVCQAQVRRIFSPASIIFKGPGFYTTDNRKNGSHSEETSVETKVHAS